MVLASVVSALAAAIASRSEQLLGVQVAWVSAVLVTVKLAARTSLTWSKPSARLPTSAARCSRRGRKLVGFVSGVTMCAPRRARGTRRGEGTLGSWRADRQGKKQSGGPAFDPGSAFPWTPSGGRHGGHQAGMLAPRSRSDSRARRDVGCAGAQRPYVRPMPSLLFTAAGSMLPSSVTTKLIKRRGVTSKRRLIARTPGGGR